MYRATHLTVLGTSVLGAQIAAAQARMSYVSDLAGAASNADIVIDNVAKISAIKEATYSGIADRVQEIAAQYRK